MKLIEVDMKMHILLAAKKMFSQYGYEATTIRQICDEAGVNSMMISYHFGGKENVLSALFQTFLPIGRLSKSELEIKDPVSGIRFIIRELITLRMNEPELFKIVQQEIFLLSPRTEMLKKIILPLWLNFRELLALGRERGLFEFESLDTTLIFILGSIFLFQHREFFSVFLTETDPKDEELISQTCTFVFSSLKYKGE